MIFLIDQSFHHAKFNPIGFSHKIPLLAFAILIIKSACLLFKVATYIASIDLLSIKSS